MNLENRIYPVEGKRKRWFPSKWSFLSIILLGTTLAFTSTHGCCLVRGSSMYPAIQDGDRILIRKKNIGKIRKGDLIVVESPEDGDSLVKRVFGLPGQFIGIYKLKKGEYWVLGDNRRVSEDSRDFGVVTNISGKVICLYRSKGFPGYFKSDFSTKNKQN